MRQTYLLNVLQRTEEKWKVIGVILRYQNELLPFALVMMALYFTGIAASDPLFRLGTIDDVKMLLVSLE